MKELLEKLENSPSILSIEDELFFIDNKVSVIRVILSVIGV